MVRCYNILQYLIMTKFSCEKCGKGFNSKSHYTQHNNRKTPCVNENKVKEMIEKSVEDKLSKLNIHIPVTSPPISTDTDATIESSSITELKEYYDRTLNMDKSTYKNSNDEPTPIDCISEMITKIPVELWSRSELSILDPCCGSRMFWFNKDHPDVLFGDCRTENHTLCDGRPLIIAPDQEMDFKALPFDDGSFNVVVSAEGIEHIGAQEHLIREARRVLSPGGRLI